MKLTEIIKSYGYKLIDVEKELGYKSGSLRNIFVRVRTGSQKSIGTQILFRVADYIGCHPAEFLLDEPTTFRGNVIEHSIPIKKDIQKYDGVQPKLDIRYVLKKMHITQKELANRIGVTTVGIMYILNNGSISVERLYQIANAIGVKVTDLFIDE